jgi:hypothetical protein
MSYHSVLSRADNLEIEAKNLAWNLYYRLRRDVYNVKLRRCYERAYKRWQRRERLYCNHQGSTEQPTHTQERRQ